MTYIQLAILASQIGSLFMILALFMIMRDIRKQNELITQVRDEFERIKVMMHL